MADNHEHASPGHGDHGDEHGHGHDFMVEEEQPPNGSLFVWGLVVAIVFFGSAALMTSLFYRTTEEVIYDKVLSVGSPELVALRKEEAQKLGTYGWVDKGKQIVHMPIEQGMKKVVEDAQK